jgi:hypothetical protein
VYKSRSPDSKNIKSKKIKIVMIAVASKSTS